MSLSFSHTLNTSSFVHQPITHAVTKLYEAHPYPRYPLLASPVWSSGYTSSFSWCASQFQDQLRGCSQKTQTKILIMGCGEILPTVMANWAPQNAFVCGVDLSLKSLRRAAFRRWFLHPLGVISQNGIQNLSLETLTSLGTPSPTRLDVQKSIRPGSYFWRGDLMEALAHSPQDYWHQMDGFGVIHHMSSPRRVLTELSRTLAPGGLLRLMVYNRSSRRWIWNIQRLFRLLNLSHSQPKDLQFARSLLKNAAEKNPKLNVRLRQMGPSTLHNDARFADTFLHPREVQCHLKTWLEWADALGMTFLGLFDRYGELDHLPNPLWHPPEGAILQKEADEGVFEGNLELYFTKPQLNKKQSATPPAQIESKLNFARRVSLLRQGPPAFWFMFPETEKIPRTKRMMIWTSFLNGLCHRNDPSLPKDLPLDAQKRLARLGALKRPPASSPEFKILSLPLGPRPHENQSVRVGKPTKETIHALWNLIQAEKFRKDCHLKRYETIVNLRLERLLYL